MITLYRIENSFGYGPFNNYMDTSIGSSMRQVYPDYPGKYNGSEYPALFEDLPAPLDNDYTLLCGVPNKDKLFYWFSEETISKLVKLGLHIKKITVDWYVEGNSGLQCFFRKENIIEETVVPIDEVLKYSN